MMFGNNKDGIKLLRDEIKENLKEYLLYRHFIRHSYSSEFKWSEMKSSFIGIVEIWKIIKMDFEKLFVQI